MGITTTKKKKDWGATIFIICMLIVPIISFLFFYVYINFNSILMAFQYRLNDGMGSYLICFKNFETVFYNFTNTKDNYLTYLLNTLIYFSQDTFVNMPLSLIICYFIYTYFYNSM